MARIPPIVRDSQHMLGLPSAFLRVLRVRTSPNMGITGFIGSLLYYSQITYPTELTDGAPCKLRAGRIYSQSLMDAVSDH